MRGNRTNYGRKDDCRRVTIRLYGRIRKELEARSKANGASIADNILWYLEVASDKIAQKDVTVL